MGIKTAGTVKCSKLQMPTGGDIVIGDTSLMDEIEALNGLDSTEVGYLNGAVAGTAAASKTLVLDASSDITSGVNDFAIDGAQLAGAGEGTANTGVTAVEHGDATFHRTVLTVSQANATGLVTDDNASLASGYLLYTFPAGDIAVHSAVMSLDVTSVEHDAEAADYGLGTTIGSGTVAVLGGTAAFENIMTGQTAALGTVEAEAVNTALMIPAAGDHTVYFNMAAAWADTAGTDDTCDLAGYVVLEWSKLS
jgi:hypothetical protein